MYTILSVSDSDKHFSIAIEEYTKRLGKKLEIKNLKPTRHGTPTQITKKDTEQVIDLLQKKYTNHKKILLSKDGEVLDTFAFKKTISDGKKTIFLIGGPYGFDENILSKYIDKKISFGAMTVPHGLAKLLILEQIYRVETMLEGKSYHY